MRRQTLTPEQARAMDKCDRIPIGLSVELAEGIIVVHRDKGSCTPADCPRLAAAEERIRIEEEATQ